MPPVHRRPNLVVIDEVPGLVHATKEHVGLSHGRPRLLHCDALLQHAPDGCISAACADEDDRGHGVCGQAELAGPYCNRETGQEVPSRDPGQVRAGFACTVW